MDCSEFSVLKQNLFAGFSRIFWKPQMNVYFPIEGSTPLGEINLRKNPAIIRFYSYFSRKNSSTKDNSRKRKILHDIVLPFPSDWFLESSKINASSHGDDCFPSPYFLMNMCMVPQWEIGQHEHQKQRNRSNPRDFLMDCSCFSHFQFSKDRFFLWARFPYFRMLLEL